MSLELTRETVGIFFSILGLVIIGLLIFRGYLKSDMEKNEKSE